MSRLEEICKYLKIDMAALLEWERIAFGPAYQRYLKRLKAKAKARATKQKV